MEDLIKQSFLSYLFLALFIGIVCVQLCIFAIQKTKAIANHKIRFTSCIAICTVFVILWGYLFVYTNLFPISLAYSECKKGVTEETVGIIESIEQDGKDRVNIVINGKEYVMVYASAHPFVDIDTDITEGDSVKISFGKKSKYIFDIYEIDFVP